MKKILIFIGTIAFFAVLTSITGSSRNLAFGIPSLLLVGIAATVCFGGKEKNVFEPIKWVTAFYCAAFAIFPILLDPPELAQYSKSNIQEAQWYLLIYFCFLLAGYKLWQLLFPVKASSNIGRNATTDYSGIAFFAVAIFLLGFFGYAFAIVRSGGIGYFLSFKGPRPEIFQHVHGLYYRLSVFMASGFALYVAIKIRKRPIVLGICTLALATAYFLFLGRGLAIAPIVIFTILYHYRVKRVQARYVALGMVAAVTLLAASAIIRDAGKNREQLLQNPVAFIESFAASASDSVKTNLLIYAEFLDTFMLIDKYVEAGNPLLKGRTLTMWFEPFERFFFANAIIDSVSSGHFVAVLRIPELKDSPTGEWPTLAGELVLNFGLLGAGLGMLCYGACIQMISRFLRVGSCSLITLAIHTYVFYTVSILTLAGSNSLTALAFFVTPLLCLPLIIKKTICHIDWMRPASGNQAISRGVYRA